MKLLIVDDSLVTRNKIKRSLLEKFSTVLHAGDGVSAVSVVIKEKPDMITMDLTMPEMHGDEAIKKIMQVAPTVRILVISALADKTTAIKALTYGANGFLCKPFTEDELCSAIKRVMNIELLT